MHPLGVSALVADLYGTRPSLIRQTDVITRRHRLVVAAAVTLVLAGCAPAGGGSDDNLSGSAVVQGLRVHEVDLDSGCIWLSDPDGARYPVVWPVGTVARSGPFEIVLADGQIVQAGDWVEGGGGYVDANAATSGSGLEPFPGARVQVGQAAVYNADSSIRVTQGDQLIGPATAE